MLFVSKRKMGSSVAFCCMVFFTTVLDLSEASREMSRGSGEDALLHGNPVEEHCDDGWLYTHKFCLLYTGLPEEEAEQFCAKENSLQALSICIKKPVNSEFSEVDDLGTREPLPSSTSSTSSSLSSETEYECPKGWTQLQNFCFIKPGGVPEICNLLGAQYLFNHCVTRIPHQLSTDFLRAVKRLDGSNYDMQRKTRLCCCRGGGYCK